MGSLRKKPSKMTAVDCQYMRYLGPHECVVRLVPSGAIVSVRLDKAVDPTRACLSSAMHPVWARITLGPMVGNRFEACELEIEWPRQRPIMPPPIRFQRKKSQGGPVHRVKRQKTGDFKKTT